MEPWIEESINHEKHEGRVIGRCIQCDGDILKETGLYEGDWYIETEDGLVHEECWAEYGRDKREKQYDNG